MDTVTVPALYAIPNVELVAAGTWQLSTGEATFTREDLAAAVDASACPAVGTPVLKLGHTDSRFNGDGQPAIGHVMNMALAASGNKISGDLAGMPGWLGAILPSAFPERSIEGQWDFRCQIGHTHQFVITAVALLGTMPPGVGTIESLADVAALYGVEAAAQRRRVAAAARSAGGNDMGSPVLAAGVTVEDVRRAYYEGPAASNYSLWITELQLSPPQLIVQDETDAKVYRVPVKISGEAVTFGDAVEVSVEYVDVAEPVAASARVTWGSRDLSRQVPEPARPALARLARLAQVRAAVGDVDADEDVRMLIASLDATLDEASQLGATVDRASVDEPNAQALDLITAAEAIVDDLMERLGIFDPDDVAAAGAHGVFTGTHSHAHSPMGSQGDDATHEHSHTHKGDAVHNHAHASAKQASKKRAGKQGTKPKGAAEMDFSDAQLAALRVKLGKAEDDDAELTPDEILAAIGEPGAGGTIAAASLPAGVVAIEQGVWDDMQARIKRGEEARAQQLRDSRDTEIAAAIRAGKFSVARKPYWERLWNKDPDGTRQVLATLATGQVPVDDIGAPGGPGDEMPDEFANLFPPAPMQRA